MVMKLLSTLFCLGLAVMSASANDVEQRRAEEVGKTYKVLKTRLNTMYKDVTVTKITDAGISIVHADGMARLGYERLTPEQREAFGITRDGEKAVHAQEFQNKAAYGAYIAEKQKRWQEEKVARLKAYEDRQKAHQEWLDKREADRLEAERSDALLALEQPDAPKAKAAANTADTSIVSVLEVPKFPVIRGYDKEVFRPMQGYTRSYRSRHYGSNRTTIYTGGYGGTYGYPVRYNNGCYSGYPSRYGTYRPSYRRGTWGAINYNGGKWNVGIRW